MSPVQLAAWLEHHEFEESGGPADGPPTLPAPRIWTDALVDIRGEHAARRLPGRSYRSGNIVARFGAAGELGRGHRQARLSFDSQPSFIARSAPLEPVLSPAEWRRLAVKLIDEGWDEGRLHEEAFIFADPGTKMRVEGGLDAVTRTHPEILNAVMDAFGADLDRYIDTLLPLDQHSDLTPEAGWEVLIPRQALLRLEPINV